MRQFPTRSRLTTRGAASLVALAAALAVIVLAVPSADAGSAANSADSGALLTWSRATPGVAPPSRLHAAVALDPAHSTTVLFGGRSGGRVLNDTWTWDGSSWTAHHPANSPPPLESASMAFDSIGPRILLFGGIGSDGNATSGTWSWDGTNWTAIVPATAPAPPARYAASMAADAVTGTDVLFGGLSVPGSPLGDTWSWDGSRWTQNLPDSASSAPALPSGTSAPAAQPPAPSPRSAAAMTFDATRGVVLLFGGATATDNRADTWTWDGKGWSPQTPATSPPARNDAALAFDNSTQNAVLFGGTSGNTVFGDTWMWNGANWSTSLPLSLLPLLNPPARRGASMAAGPGAHRVVLFGGETGGIVASILGDTWNVATLATGPPTTTPTTPAGSSPSTVGPAPPTTGGLAAPLTTRPAPPATRPPPPRPSLGVTSSSVHRGQPVTVSGSGFAPGAVVTITFRSAPVVVGTATADAEGRFTAVVSVPSALSNGTHHIEAMGKTSSGEQAVLTAMVRITPPGVRTSWLLVAFMVALTVLLAAGAGLVLTASTRWRPFSAPSNREPAG